MRSIHRPSLSRPFLELRSMWRLWYENALGFVSWECGDVWSCSLSPSARLATSHEVFFFSLIWATSVTHTDLNSRLKTPLSFYVSTVCFQMHQVETSLCHCRYIMQFVSRFWCAVLLWGLPCDEYCRILCGCFFRNATWMNLSRPSHSVLKSSSRPSLQF